MNYHGQYLGRRTYAKDQDFVYLIFFFFFWTKKGIKVTGLIGIDTFWTENVQVVVNSQH